MGSDPVATTHAGRDDVSDIESIFAARVGGNCGNDPYSDPGVPLLALQLRLVGQVKTREDEAEQ